MTALGASGLLRVAAFPAHLWLRGSNPELFRLVRVLNETASEYRGSAVDLAERIGCDLIPRDFLTDRDRGWVLGARRRLHGGGLLVQPDATRLAKLAEHSAELVRAIRAAAERATLVERLEREAVAAIEAEERRLLGLPWQVARGTPLVEQAMRHADPALFADIERRVAGGEAWQSKRMRRRDGHLWRLIDRGSNKPTPRGWFAHVGLVRFDGSAARLALTGRSAWQWIENLHGGRAALLDGGSALDDDATLLTVTPLHWYDGDVMVAWVTKLDATVSVTEVRVRRIPVLEAICAALRLGALALGALAKTIVPDADAARREVLRRFLAYLVDVGIVEVCRPPRRVIGAERVPSGGDGFLDVYRCVSGTVPPAIREELASGIQQALRVLRLIHEDVPASSVVPWPEITAEPRPALAVFRERLEATKDRVSHDAWHGTGWPVPRTENSGYRQLVSWLDRAAEDSLVLDVSAGLLDSFGAPDSAPSWPVDCLLRLLPDGAALDLVAPGAMLDARFVDALEELSGVAGHVTAYRRFLQRVEEETGHLMVEVLVPPMSIRAANAVRRPRYTSAWTGDADLTTYCGDGGPARYIPLDAIMLRRDGTSIVATVDGRPIWPVHHATRLAPPPWDTLVGLLRSAAPKTLTYPFGVDLRRSLDALPGRRFLPRITVGGRLVLSAAQWRIDRADLWRAGDSTLVKARKLDALRDRLGLPRWVLLVDPRRNTSMLRDLESLRTIQAFDRLLDQDVETVTVVEALPAPADYPVADSSHGPTARHMAQLMMRLPLEGSADDLARTAAAATAAQFMRKGVST